MALGYLSLALPLAFTWRQTATALFGKAAYPLDDQHGHLLHIYASALCSTSAVAFALEELARRRLLHSYTADLLKLGMIGNGAACFLLFLVSHATLTFTAMFVACTVSLATAAVPASQLLHTAADRRRVWRVVENIPNNLSRFFSRSRSSRHERRALAFIYAFWALTIPLLGVIQCAAPRRTLSQTFGYDYGRSTQLLWKVIAVGRMTTMLALLMALKHLGDIDLMGSTPARTLNLGLMATSVGHVLVLRLVLSVGSYGAILPGVGALWVMVLLTSLLGLVAPEVDELIEQVAEEAKAK